MNIFIVLCSIVWLSVGTVLGQDEDSGPPVEIETSEDHLIAVVLDEKESKKNNDQDQKQKKSDKPKKSDRPEKTEKPDKTDKTEKSEKSEKSEKVVKEKSDAKSEKKERPDKKQETEEKVDDKNVTSNGKNDDSKIIPISEVQMLKNGVKRKCKSGEWLRND